MRTPKILTIRTKLLMTSAVFFSPFEWWDSQVRPGGNVAFNEVSEQHEATYFVLSMCIFEMFMLIQKNHDELQPEKHFFYRRKCYK